MGIYTVLATALLVYGPVGITVLYTAGSHPYLLFVLLLAGFFQIVALLAAGGLARAWEGHVDLLPVSMVVSVCFQEAVRIGFQSLLQRSDKVLIEIIDSKDVRSLRFRINTAMAAGLGFGFVSVTVVLAPILEAAGVGHLRASGCSDVSFYLVAGLTGLAMILHHLVWSIIAFEGEKRGRNIPGFVTVLIVHLGASSLTLLNNSSCGGGLGGLWGLLVVETVALVMFLRSRPPPVHYQAL